MKRWEPWLMQLIDGLATYDAEHPTLYYESGAAPDQKLKADCPCHLLRLVPADLRNEAIAYMEGQRAACTCPLVEATQFDDAKPRYVRGKPLGCPVHGDELDPDVAKAIEEARAA